MTDRFPTVTVIHHPLVQHKLTLLRDKATSTAAFRQIAREMGLLMCYEVTRDLPLHDVDIETPLERTRAPQLAGKKLCFVPILRAGNGILDGMLDAVPGARVGHIGLYRDPRTLQAIEYYLKLPDDLSSAMSSWSTRCWPPATRRWPASPCCDRPAPPRSAWCA